MNKIISIIIATYNASQTLERCLKSIIPQLSDSTELIVIDGKSTDTTLQIIESYAPYISYYLSEKDRGIYDAWNKGIEKSNGQWIMFIGADDILLPHSIDYYIDEIQKRKNMEEYDYICANNKYTDNEGKTIKIIGGEPSWNVMRRKMNAAHVASLHNKCNLFNTVGSYNIGYRICADYELLIRKKNQLKYLYLPGTIAQMQIGGVSFSMKAIKETYNIRKEHQSVPTFLNRLLFLYDSLLFHLFILRHKLKGYSIQ